ncbi:hypothetical protein GCM10027176_72380 [Actinoallomurus bryophytorum]
MTHPPAPQQSLAQDNGTPASDRVLSVTRGLAWRSCTAHGQGVSVSVSRASRRIVSGAERIGVVSPRAQSFAWSQ